MTKHIEFKNATGTHIAEVLANKGIYWLVRDDAGEEYPVPKKQVTRGPWEETEDDTKADEARFNELKAQAAGHSLLSAAVSQATVEPAPKAKRSAAEPKVIDPNLVTLKQLCFELNVIPRIARRRLRKALGNVGTGSRWEWTKDSPEYAQVVAALTTPAPADEAEHRTNTEDRRQEERRDDDASE